MARSPIKRRSLWQVSVIISLEAEDAVVELLGRLFPHIPSVYTNEETWVTTVSVYCLKRAEWTEKKRVALAAGLKLIRANGLDTGPGKIRFQRVAKEDWSESWKRHFKPIEIGLRLLIKPSWIKRAPKRNQAVVILDPGLSFGTGNHATTAFCLSELAVHGDDGEKKSLWDVGTGSGILAIAAAKLGYAPIHAFDFDPEAVRVAKENARQNKVLPLLILTQQDLTKLPRKSAKKYDFICANLISTLLLAEQDRILNRLNPDGRLVLAGILKKEFVEVQRAFEKRGMKLVSSRSEKEWRSGAFVFVSEKNLHRMNKISRIKN